MKLVHVKSAIATSWILGALIVSVASPATSLRGWTTLIGLSVVPPLALLRFWNGPAPTMSESIAAARR
jgi:hypothetical protein